MNSRNLIVLIAVLILMSGSFIYYFLVIGKPNPALEANPEEIIAQEGTQPELEEENVGIENMEEIGETKTSEASEEAIEETSVEEGIFGLSDSEAKNAKQRNFSLAQEKAKEWQDDATLYQAIFKLTYPFNANEGAETYVFGSSLAPSDWWTFTLSQNSSKFVRAIIPKVDYLGEIPGPAATNFWNTSYIEALRIAEQNGGKEFRGKDGKEIEITLATSEPKNWLWWTVNYKDSAGETLKIQIDPNKGEVLNKSKAEETAGKIEESTPILEEIEAK